MRREPEAVRAARETKARDEEELKRRAGERKRKREMEWTYMLRTPTKGGGALKQTIKIGPVTLDKIAGGQGWIGQGSAEHRTRKRRKKSESEAVTPTGG